jgi:hypothetical protein
MEVIWRICLAQDERSPLDNLICNHPHRSKDSLCHDFFRKETLIMKISLRLIGCVVAFMTVAVTGALAQEPVLNIQLVGRFDYPGTGNQTRPQKINANGDIVGIYVDSSGVSRGFLRLKNGSFSPPIVDPADTGNLTEGRGINNSRLVCGDYFNATSGTFHGFFFFQNGYRNYDVTDSTTTIVLGLNNVGDFAGSVTPTGGIQEAFLSIGGTVTEFSVTGATASLAYQLNASNQSCGYYTDSSGVTHGFYRDSDGTIHAPIDPVGSTGTILFGNNDANLIVGRYSDATGVTHGILFVPPSQFLVFDFPQSTFTSFNGINNQRRIVGRFTDSSGIDHGILLQVAQGGTNVTVPLAPASAPASMGPQRVVNVAPAY